MDQTQMYPWVKMYPLRIFHGSLRIQCELKERGLWYELIFWAKICSVTEMFPANDVIDHEHVEKLISANETTPYPREYMAQFFGVDKEWLEYALDKLKEQRRIREDERGIWIINWEKYQPEYDRQKIYRTPEKQASGSQKPPPKGTYADVMKVHQKKAAAIAKKGKKEEEE